MGDRQLYMIVPVGGGNRPEGPGRPDRPDRPDRPGGGGKPPYIDNTLPGDLRPGGGGGGGGGRPDQGLPGEGVGGGDWGGFPRPDNTLPGDLVDGGGLPPEIENGLPGEPIWPGVPIHPETPEHPIALPPGSIYPPLPPIVDRPAYIVVWVPGLREWRVIVLGAPARPDNTLPPEGTEGTEGEGAQPKY